MPNPLVTKLERVVALSPSDREALNQICRDTRRIGARRPIIRQGQKPGHVHVMLEGWAARYETLGNGSHQITAFLLPGDHCDQHVTILPAMDHDIVTLTSALVAYLPNGQLEELGHTRPDIARALWWSTLADEAVLRAWIVNIGRRPALQRVAHLICELHARLDNIGLTRGGAFEFPLTQEQLGDALGLTPVHVNRMIQRLRREGLIELAARILSIPDVESLRAMAGFTPGYLHGKVASDPGFHRRFGGNVVALGARNER